MKPKDPAAEIRARSAELSARQQALISECDETDALYKDALHGSFGLVLRTWFAHYEETPWKTAELYQVLSDDRVAAIRHWARTTSEDLSVEIARALHEDAGDTGGLSRYRVVLVDGEHVRARKELDYLGSSR